jgi:hypothetical protein
LCQQIFGVIETWSVMVGFTPPHLMGSRRNALFACGALEEECVVGLDRPRMPAMRPQARSSYPIFADLDWDIGIDFEGSNIITPIKQQPSST